MINEMHELLKQLRQNELENHASIQRLIALSHVEEVLQAYANMRAGDAPHFWLRARDSRQAQQQ